MHATAERPLLKRLSAALRSLVPAGFGPTSAALHEAGRSSGNEIADGPLDGQELRAELGLELERTKRGNRLLSVLVGTLCHVDETGTSHEATAALQQRALSVIARQRREIDLAGQVDDGSFLVILPETGQHGALVLAERLRSAVAVAFSEESSPPILAFGVATFGRHGRTSNALIDAAKRALAAALALERSLVESDEVTVATAAQSYNGANGDGGLEMALSLAETVDVHDRGIVGQSQAVGRYAMSIARELGLDGAAAERVRLAGLLHDVGKVGVSRSVLQKPGRLSEQEWSTVRLHPEIGARLLAAPGLADIREWVLRHHERPDGEGYPDGLTAGEIPLQARIVAVADAYEAMTAERVHAAALTDEHARAELLHCGGRQFDRRVVQAFLRVLDRQTFERNSRATA